MTHLKPCPFCGGRAVPRPFVGNIGGAGGTEPHFVRCESCKTATSVFNLREEATAAWNRRTSDAPVITFGSTP